MRRCLSSFLLLASCAMPAAACPALFDRTLNDIREQPRSLCEYAGKVVLVVNTASQCGYTPQYEGLEALQRKYRDRGFVVLGFPSNDFGGQEPGSNQEIAAFCVNQYAIDFPMFAKSSVRGADANPLFADLAKATGSAPRWNFHKYLVARDGKEALAFATKVDPQDPSLVAAIERLLGAR
ncbi:MAG TPA: glutathione peroxidase [Burkholderiales bacterium]|nr:glutathione peroxidase [Burkholderiales bacterium]